MGRVFALFRRKANSLQLAVNAVFEMEDCGAGVHTSPYNVGVLTAELIKARQRNCEGIRIHRFKDLRNIAELAAVNLTNESQRQMQLVVTLPARTGNAAI